MPSPSSSRVRERLLEVLTPIVSGTGYDLEDVTVTSAGRRSLVRVVVDGDSGIDLDGVAEVSRVVSAALDGPAGSEFPGPFVLEVTSPGVDRPLTAPRHWRRAAGRLVQVPLDGGLVTGRVLAADDTSVTLDLDGQRRTVELDRLGAGRVQVEFGRPSATEDTDETDADADDDTDDTDDTVEAEEQ